MCLVRSWKDELHLLVGVHIVRRWKIRSFDGPTNLSELCGWSLLRHGWDNRLHHLCCGHLSIGHWARFLRPLRGREILRHTNFHPRFHHLLRHLHCGHVRTPWRGCYLLRKLPSRLLFPCRRVLFLHALPVEHVQYRVWQHVLLQLSTIPIIPRRIYILLHMSRSHCYGCGVCRVHGGPIRRC